MKFAVIQPKLSICGLFFSILLALFVSSIFDGLIPHALAHNAGTVPPSIVLWAWQRAENLSYIDPRLVGVAYLACQIELAGDSVRYHWRDQPLRVPAGTSLLPVVRIDTDRRNPPLLSAQQRAAVIKVLQKASFLSGVSNLQIDFDAMQSERSFYSKLLEDLKDTLPTPEFISMTALASWCLYDNWISNLPVDEMVPMMFSLGRERPKILLYFSGKDNQFLAKGCCNSVGLSLEDLEVNQLMIPLIKQRKMPVRFYFYTKSAWTREKVQRVQSLLHGQREH